LSEVDGACLKTGIRIVVTPGNHEDWDRIESLPVNSYGLQRLNETDYVSFLPRGYRWTMAGRSFVSLGGAPSIDYASRRKGKSWWPAEAITDEDVTRIVAGGHADIMLAHDAPVGVPVVDSIVRRSAYDWPSRARKYTREGRAKITAAFQGVRPALFAHGHYHAQAEATVAHDDGSRCTVLSLSEENTQGNLGLLNLAEQAPDVDGVSGLSWEWL
jgi:hypothetical protein